jgi:predicted amidohydrolase
MLLTINAYAQVITNNFEAEMQSLKQYGIWLLPGSISKSEGKIYNTASVINPKPEKL